MMTVDIEVSQLLKDIRTKSHTEVSFIQDPNVRYMAEAGSEKLPEIKRCVISADARLRTLLNRFLMDEMSYASNDAELPEYIEYAFDVAPRRAVGKAQPLADTIHKALVDMALSLFYVSVSQADLAKLHDQLSQADLKAIEELAYQKKAPRSVAHFHDMEH